MVQDLSGFVPEVWSKKLSLNFDNNGVAMQVVNKDYEGEIKTAGDTVKIRGLGDITVRNYSSNIVYDELSSDTQNLLIDQKKYFAFKCDDIEKAQSNIDIISKYTERADIAIDLTKDTRILSHVAQAGTSNTQAAITKDNVYSVFVDIMTALKDANAVRSGMTGKKMPWVIINPTIEAVVLQAPEFIQDITGEKVRRGGSIGEMAGLEVLVSTNFTASGGVHNIMAGTNEAITFAGQVVKVEAMRLQDSFDTAIRGLYVYGSKVVNSAALVKQPVTVS